MVAVRDYLASIDDVDLRAKRLCATFSREQLTWRPQQHAWSIAQNLDHLGATGEIYLGRAEASTGRLQSSCVASMPEPTIFGRVFIRNIEPPAKVKVKAPKTIVPLEQPDPEAALSRLLAVNTRVRKLLSQCGERDLTTTIQNPFIPVLRIRIATVLLVVVAHSRRHLWQSEQVQVASGFPST